MEIHLKESEIQEALLEHIGNTGVPLSNCVTTVTLVAGRGANGHSAVISIERNESKKDASDVEEDGNENQQAIKFDFGNNEED